MSNEKSRNSAKPFVLPVRMDLRSPSGQVGSDKARLIVNFLNNSRIPGLKMYGHDDPAGFLNQDLHDQLLGAVRDQVPRDVE